MDPLASCDPTHRVNDGIYSGALRCTAGASPTTTGEPLGRCIRSQYNASPILDVDEITVKSQQSSAEDHHARHGLNSASSSPSAEMISPSPMTVSPVGVKEGFPAAEAPIVAPFPHKEDPTSATGVSTSETSTTTTFTPPTVAARDEAQGKIRAEGEGRGRGRGRRSAKTEELGKVDVTATSYSESEIQTASSIEVKVPETNPQVSSSRQEQADRDFTAIINADPGGRKRTSVAEVLSALQRRKRGEKMIIEPAASIPPVPDEKLLGPVDGALKYGVKKPPKDFKTNQEATDEKRGATPERRDKKRSKSVKQTLDRVPDTEIKSEVKRTHASSPDVGKTAVKKPSKTAAVSGSCTERKESEALVAKKDNENPIEALNAMIASAWDLNNVYGSDAVDDSMAPQKLWDPLSFESAAALDAESGKGEGAINGKSRPKLLSALYKEVKAAFRQNLHSLIDPCDFKPRDSEGNPLISHNIEQPFDVFVHPQIGVLCDVHAHLCEAEVIGLLAGTVVSCNSPTCTKPEGEENNRASRYIMYVQQAYPCPSTVRLEDNGSTDVELDPLAELAARDAIAAAGMQVVGWYHSHPSFKAKPSAIDVFNQSQYQRLVRNPSDGLEPFVGLIISTYDKSLPTPASAHNWFYTIRYSESTRNSCEIDVPMNLTTKTLRSIRRHGDTSLKLFIDQDDQINVIKTRINAMFASKVPESVHAPDNSKDRDNPSSGSAATSDLAIDDAESSSAAVPIGAVEQAPPTSSGGGVMSKLPDTELYTMSGRRRKAPVLYEDVRATKRSKKTEAIAIAEPAIKDTRPTDAPSRTETVRCVGTIVEALMLQYPVNSLEAGVSSCKSGCDILSNISGPMQMLVVGLLSLVQYYSYNLYRVDLNERVKWKECGSKLKKLFISARRWFDYFDLPAADVDRFLTEFEGYLVGTWSKNKQLC